MQYSPCLYCLFLFLHNEVKVNFSLEGGCRILLAASTENFLEFVNLSITVTYSRVADLCITAIFTQGLSFCLYLLTLCIVNTTVYHKNVWGIEIQIKALFTCALNGCELSQPRWWNRRLACFHNPPDTVSKAEVPAPSGCRTPVAQHAALCCLGTVTFRTQYG